MYARIEKKRVKRSRIVLTDDMMKRMCYDFNINESTLRKYLNDIYNENVTAPMRNKVLCAAINDYKGRVEEQLLWKDVVVLDKNDAPENHERE